MKLSVHNLTTSTLVADVFASGSHVLFPATATTVDMPKGSRNVSLSRCKNDLGSREHWSVSANDLGVRFSLAFGSSWQRISVPDECSWRIYRQKVTRKHHRLIVVPQRDSASFLSQIPDSVPLSSLLLPGTHDTMAFYGWPIAQCQSSSTSLATQLQAGIRVIDIRLSLIKGKLIAYHSVYPQKELFQSILATLYTFLSATSPGAQETVVVSIKQENFVDVDAHTFSRAVRTEIEQSVGGLGLWFLENRIPNLGEVRGRCVLFSRFGADGAEWPQGLAGLGIHPSRWPDSAQEVWDWTCANTRVRMHDWYRVPTFLSIPEKVDRATAVLLPEPEALPAPTLNVSFFSASSFPLASPPTIAKGFGWPSVGFGVEGVNARVVRWVLGMLAGGAEGQRATREGKAPTRGADDVGAAMQKAEAATRTNACEDDVVSQEAAWEKEAALRRRSGDVQLEEPRVRGWTLIDFYREPENTLVPLLIELNFRGRRSGEEGWP